MNARLKSYSLFAALLFTVCSFTSFSPAEKLGMKLVSKSVQNGKSVTTKAEVYYKTSGSVLVTRILFPAEYIVITNGKGEFKMYDVKANTVSQAQSVEFSSENSFIYDFLSGNTNDMGLRRMGFQLKRTRVEENMVITEWIPPLEIASSVNRLELAHENYLPACMIFYGKKDKPISKTFYYNYKKAGTLSIPLTITEFQYHPNGDSTITKRAYSDIKLNEDVDSRWLDFKIPENAKPAK